MESIHEFSSYDGTILQGTLRTPDKHCGALVLLVHGITSTRDELGLFSGLAERLEMEGIPSFRFDYRCHGVRKRPLREMTLAGIVLDVEAAAQFATVSAEVSRIFVVGMSFGGGLSAFWASSTRLQVGGVIMFAPVIDYEEDAIGSADRIDGWKVPVHIAKALQKRGYARIDGLEYGKDLINEARFINGIEGIRSARHDILILHGDCDSVVPFASTLRFASLSDRCRVITISGTDHGFGVQGDDDLTSPETKAKHRLVFEHVLEFVQERRPHAA